MGFLEKTTARMVSTLRETILSEEIAGRPGLLQRLDARIKVVSFFLLLIFALSVPTEALAGLALLLLGLAWASRIPPGTLIRRIGPPALFAVLVALPILFFPPGGGEQDPAALLVLLRKPYVALTMTGVRTALTLVLRVTVSFTLALLLSLTTPWPALLRALRSLGLPQVLLTLLSMTRRYIILLLQKAEEMFLSRRSRLVGRLPAREGWRLSAAVAGALLVRAYEMSQEVYLAMEARGEGIVRGRPAEGRGPAPLSPLQAEGPLPLLSLHGVRYTYPGGVVALDGVDLEIWPGERVAVLGANGSGKSTLLKVLDGLYFPQEGKVRFLGRPITPSTLEDGDFARDFRRRVGLVFQNPDVQLFSATVWDEVAFAPLQLGLSREEVRERVEKTLSWLGLLPLRDRPPYRLSEGEKRKVALASVLVYEPEVLLLDEPTDPLDPQSRAQLLDFFLEWGSVGDEAPRGHPYRQGVPTHTLVLCTHDLALARKVARRVVVLDRGRVLTQGRPEEFPDVGETRP